MEDRSQLITICKERGIKSYRGKSTEEIKAMIDKDKTLPKLLRVEENKLYHQDCIEYMKLLPEKSVNLIIADPPYYKVVKEEWDNVWRSEEEYLGWIELWLTEVARVAKPVASFYIFGYFRVLCKVVGLIEKHGFKLRQNITISKGLKSISGRNTSQYQMFPTTTECVLFFVRDNKKAVKTLLLQRQKDLKLTSKAINEKLGMKSNGGGVWSLYTGNNILEQYPTEEMWHKLESLLDFKMDYSDVRHVFNIEEGITDVWDDINFYEERKSRIHPTQKPHRLIERIVRASSNPGMVVLDPFMGSGTTAVVCREMGRIWYGCEKNHSYYEAAARRLGQQV